MRPTYLKRIATDAADRLSHWWYFRTFMPLLRLAPRPVWRFPALALAAARWFFDGTMASTYDALLVACGQPLTRRRRWRMRFASLFRHEVARLLLLQSERITPAWVRSQFRIQGSLPSDGAILVTPHHTGGTCLSILLTSLGKYVGTISIVPDDPAECAHLSRSTQAEYRLLRASTAYNRTLGSLCFRPHEAGRKGLRLLGAGGYLIVAADGFNLAWSLGPLLGRAVPLPQGPIWFAQRANKPIVPIIAILEKRGWRVWLGTPIPPLLATQETLARAIEECIVRAPESWHRGLAAAWAKAPAWQSV